MRCEVAGKLLEGSGMMTEGEKAAEVSMSYVVALFCSTSTSERLNEPITFAVCFFLRCVNKMAKKNDVCISGKGSWLI